VWLLLVLASFWWSVLYIRCDSVTEGTVLYCIIDLHVAQVLVLTATSRLSLVCSVHLRSVGFMLNGYPPLLWPLYFALLVVAYGIKSVEVTLALISVDLFVRDMSLVLAPLPDFISPKRATLSCSWSKLQTH
jgi:hypothetical protein